MKKQVTLQQLFGCIAATCVFAWIIGSTFFTPDVRFAAAGLTVLHAAILTWQIRDEPYLMLRGGVIAGGCAGAGIVIIAYKSGPLALLPLIGATAKPPTPLSDFAAGPFGVSLLISNLLMIAVFAYCVVVLGARKQWKRAALLATVQCAWIALAKIVVEQFDRFSV